MKYILSVDIGTTSLKAVLFDEELNTVSRAKVDYGTDYPAPGWAEQDANQWWAALKTATESIFHAGGKIDVSDVEIIAVDAMTPAVVGWVRTLM